MLISDDTAVHNETGYPVCWYGQAVSIQGPQRQHQLYVDDCGIPFSLITGYNYPESNLAGA